MWQSCDSHVIVMWQSCDSHVIVMWQSCDAMWQSCDQPVFVRTTSYIDQMSAWYDKRTTQEVVNLKLWEQLQVRAPLPSSFFLSLPPFFSPFSFLSPSSLPLLFLTSTTFPLPLFLPLGSSWYIWSECPRSSVLFHDCERAAEISQVSPTRADEIATLDESTGGISSITGGPTTAHTYVMWLAYGYLQ